MSITTFKNYFVFDLDDTLVDGRQFCGETIARVITHFDNTADFYRIVKLHEEKHGLTIYDLYDSILRDIDLHKSLSTKIPEMLEMDKKIQTKDIEKLKIFDGVIDIFEFLKSHNKKVYMCTNRIESLLRLAMKHNDIEKYFDKIVSCVDRGYKKPDPTCLNEMIEESKAKREEFIYFGDSVVDSDFARNAGIEHIIFDQYLNDKNIFKKLINMFLEEKINGFK